MSTLKVEIDLPALTEEILEGIESVSDGGVISCTTCVGSFGRGSKKVQLHLTVTRDEDERIDTNFGFVKVHK